MPCDFIQYYVFASNIKLHEETAVSVPNSVVKEIRLAPRNDENSNNEATTTILIRCLFNSISDRLVAEVEAKKVIAILLGKLSYTHTNAIFSDPFFSYMYSNGQVTTTSELQSSLTVRGRLDITKIKNIALEEDHIFLFRSAHSINNDSLRLTMLYGLFEKIVDTKLSTPGNKHAQHTVDLIIYFWQKQRGVSTLWKKSSKPNAKHPETIYTWLRNQIGHSQADGYKYNIHPQISDHITEFVDLVKKSMADYELINEAFYEEVAALYQQEKSQIIASLQI
ncbi:hypothetical protein [Paenibacillus polymyxa]|uniref:hypothetical protein n=1 Tax=Paenibacillus polymyxa TaxID=1406 RepID=UPI000845D1CA|nr:hypothetical protein [Paenibacillus polymyxa]AOK88972.1 hypothetical protein AOU00_03610 [Paenibacillus polymyxa]